MPPEPPCTSTRFPASGMEGDSACHAVSPATGNAAAVSKLMLSGMRMSRSSRALTTSAYVPANRTIGVAG